MSINPETPLRKPSVKITKIIFLILIGCLITPQTVLAKEVKIALRAFKGEQAALSHWQPTADYLSQSIPGYTFKMVPFVHNSALNQAVSRGEFEFSLTNPAASVEHIIRYNARPLATLVNKRQGKGYAKFGSVIFTHKDRHDIRNLHDLKGKVFIASDELGFGGWRVAWRELLKNNINPYSDFNKILFAGGLQQKVVYAVRDGTVDAGSVRTDMLERLAAENKINLSDFKILAPKHSEDFPFLHSTQLYPEWLFTSFGEIDNKLKTQMIKALFSIDAQHPAAQSGKYIGWISPLDYSSVDELLKELHVGPYHVSTMGFFESMISQYSLIILSVITVISILVLTILYMVKLNMRITQTRDSLKEEVSTRESLERQLMHIQKMESLGQLTGGIAHDFNNMLAVILGFTELALKNETVNNDAKLTKYLNHVMATSEKAKVLIKQMLAFSRAEGDFEKTEAISIKETINEIYQLLRPLLPSNIKLVINNNHDLYIDSSQVMINQVLMNICLNAKQAIGQAGGTIEVSTDTVQIEHKLCDSCHKDFNGEFVQIQITDNGKGIDETMKHRLFEPFFSTKEVGKGTGMGLAMVHGIIHNHGGHITLESEINKGTSFKLLLPIATPSDKTRTDNMEITESANTKKNKHILIIDDEKPITDYLVELLTQHSYTVSTFNASEEALKYFEDNAQSIDLVLTDQTMPGITGIELAHRIQDISPSLPIIVCTGYSEYINNQAPQDLNIYACLDKPVKSENLLQTIELALSQGNTH